MSTAASGYGANGVVENPCRCEHFSHEDGTDHAYQAVGASTYEARYVGHVCAHCARTHMAEYLLPYQTRRVPA